MSHVKLNSEIKQTRDQEKLTESKIEKFSDFVTGILRLEAAAKSRKLVYVFISVNQLKPLSFSMAIDDSRDKISDTSRNLIEAKFVELFGVPARE